MASARVKAQTLSQQSFIMARPHPALRELVSRCYGYHTNSAHLARTVGSRPRS
ncbi:MAG: hypothetical protein H0V49_10475 [Nocardioidaceae bacterium]|nr:hypothetical protein [Nocardioidaceae bacterium]